MALPSISRPIAVPAILSSSKRPKTLRWLRKRRGLHAFSLGCLGLAGMVLGGWLHDRASSQYAWQRPDATEVTPPVTMAPMVTAPSGNHSAQAN